jgi:transposase-like protein
MKKQEDFMKMLVEGLSYREISEKLNVSTTTLCSWKKQYNREIGNMKVLKNDEMIKKIEMTIQARLECYGGNLNKIKEELEKRSMENVSTDKLIDMMFKLENKIEEIAGQRIYIGEDTDGLMKLLEDPKEKWSL